MNGRVIAKGDAQIAADPRQFDGERMGVAAFVVRAEDPADQMRPHVGESGFDGDAFVGVHDNAFAAGAVHHLHLGQSLAIFLFVSENVENAACELIVLNARGRAQFGQLGSGCRPRHGPRVRY